MPPASRAARYSMAMFRSPKRLLALLLCSVPLTAEVRSLTILHSNDLHARLLPLANGHGGFASIAALIRHERANCTDCIYLDAGDLVQGTPVSTLFKGLPVYEIANLLGFDAATLGNHEFDYGWQQIRLFLRTARYPIVTSNVVDGQGKLMTARPYVILKVNGLRVGVIGAMTDTLSELTNPHAVGEWHTIPVLATARKVASEIRGKSDLIVLLGHITGEEERAFLESAPEIPVLVTGHVHSGLPEAVTRDGRILVRVKCYGEEIGKLTLQVDTVKKAPLPGWKWTRITVDPTALPPAEDVAREVKRWESEVSARVDVPLAVAKRSFNRAEVRGLVEQAMRDATGADFAFLNADGVRDILPQGQLLERHIWNIMPFDNVVVVGTFKGRDLPAVVVGDRHVDPDREYTLAVTDFTAANQATAENLRTKGLVFPKEYGAVRDIVLDWFRKKKVIE
jgi:2',3'-cyclic-nucleotide 2'-phosphodiesterase (5'-nucleotidase family)